MSPSTLSTAQSFSTPQRQTNDIWESIKDEQYKWVEQQVKATAKRVSSTIPTEQAVPEEPARPRTRAECIKVRVTQEERVVNKSKMQGRRKKAI